MTGILTSASPNAGHPLPSEKGTSVLVYEETLDTAQMNCIIGLTVKCY